MSGWRPSSRLFWKAVWSISQMKDLPSPWGIEYYSHVSVTGLLYVHYFHLCLWCHCFMARVFMGKPTRAFSPCRLERHVGWRCQNLGPCHDSSPCRMHTAYWQVFFLWSSHTVDLQGRIYNSVCFIQSHCRLVAHWRHYTVYRNKTLTFTTSYSTSSEDSVYLVFHFVLSKSHAAQDKKKCIGAKTKYTPWS